MDGDSCKELDEVVLRGMACMAAELIVSVRCETATSISEVEQLPVKHWEFREVMMADW
jgi:hypothetical protein